MWMRSRTALACVAAATALAVAGCGDDEDGEDTGGGGSAAAPTTDSAATPGAPEASVEFLTPKDGSTTGEEFTAKVKLENFELDPGAVGKSPVPGKGHLHFQLDGGRFDIPENSGENGKLAKKLGVDGKYSPSVTPEITYQKIPPGKHTLEIYLANNNHTDTGVEAETEFTVK
jgi:hypothetical protein